MMRTRTTAGRSELTLEAIVRVCRLRHTMLTSRGTTIGGGHGHVRVTSTMTEGAQGQSLSPGLLLGRGRSLTTSTHQTEPETIIQMQMEEAETVASKGSTPRISDFMIMSLKTITITTTIMLLKAKTANTRKERTDGTKKEATVVTDQTQLSPSRMSRICRMFRATQGRTKRTLTLIKEKYSRLESLSRMNTSGKALHLRAKGKR